MFILNLIIDIFFFIDILVTFRTGFINDDGNEVMSGREIGIEYVKGMFWIDLVATIPMD
tara:strand:- start:1988 stop:2164 length:177 start_codon:yes stop_codon:yes gene_type:complete